MTDMPKNEIPVVQSVDRAISLLFSISENPEAKCNLDNLSEALEIDRSSVFRLLSTLMKYGLVRQDESRKCYQLGLGIYKLAGALCDQLKITEITSPALKRLASVTQENSHLAVLSGNRAVFIDRERAAKSLAANTNIGDTEELHCTAVGKCLISNFDRAGLIALLGVDKLPRYTENTIVELDDLVRELSLTKTRGYSLDHEEYERNMICLAAPIYNFKGTVEASIGISAPRERMEAQLEYFIAEVKAAGEELSAQLGGGRRKAAP